MGEIEDLREMSRQLFNEGVIAKTENRQLKECISNLESALAVTTADMKGWGHRCEELKAELAKSQKEIERQKRERQTDQHVASMEVGLKNREINSLRAEVERWKASYKETSDQIQDVIKDNDTLRASLDTEKEMRRVAESHYQQLIGFLEGHPPDTYAARVKAAAEKFRASNAELREAKDTAYSERDQLVCALSKLFPSTMERHPDSDTTWENDWRWIVFINLPTGQATWHIHDSELWMFDHLKRKTGVVWDGHTTPEKYARLAALLKD